MTIPLFGKFKLFCIALTLALGACGGGSDGGSSPPPPAPVPVVVAPPVPAPAPVVVVPPVVDKTSVLTLQLLDTRSQAEGAGPLRDSPYDSFSFLLDGKSIVVTSRDIDNAKTFADLRSAIDGAINAQKAATPALANLAVTLGPNYAVFDPASGVPVVGQSILLTNTGGGIIKRNLAGGWLATKGFAPPGSIYGNIIEGSRAPQAPVPEDVGSPVPDNRSVLTLQLMDTRSQAAGTGPLRENQFDGFSFLLDRKPIVVRSPAINTAKTFADLRAAIQGAIDRLKPSTPALAEFVVTLGANYTVFDTVSELPVVGQSILITDQSGGIITVSYSARWLTVEGLVFPGSMHNAMIEGIPAPAPPVLGVATPAALDKRSVLRLELLDTRSQAAGTGPLLDNPYDGFSFLLNGTPIVVRSPAINAAKTFANLRSAIDSAINALKPTNPALANLAVTRGPTYARFDASSGLAVVGQSILLTDLSGGIITINPAGGWSTPSGVTPADNM